MTTEQDHQIMERLTEAIRSGEVHDDLTMGDLCERLKATPAHCLAVAMQFGGRWPWRDRISFGEGVRQWEERRRAQ